MNTFVYGNNELGPESIKMMARMFHRIRELQINHVSCLIRDFNSLLHSCIHNNMQLMKLKLSNVNLQDNQLVDQIIEVLKTKEFLTHLDLSWTRLNPKQLLKISEVLIDSSVIPGPLTLLRNLNLSYNSLYFDESSK